MKIRSTGGQAIMVALILIIFLLPLGVVLYKSGQTAMKSAYLEGQQKDSVQVATDIITDYMRAFSQDQYNGHYDADSLGRPASGYYGNTVSTITYIASQTNHTLYLDITAGVNSVNGVIQHPKRIQALIAFISDLVLYGTMFNSATTLNANGSTYNGGFYVNGNFTESGTGVTWNGGPLIVNGSVTTAAGDTVDGNLYYASTKAGITVNGTAYNYVPTFSWPSVNTQYYAVNAATITQSPTTITFYSTGTYRMQDKNGSNQLFSIPSNGVIIFASNTYVNVSGIVSGAATVVAYGSNDTLGCSASANVSGPANSNNGQINIIGNLYYAGASSTSATTAGSFAAIASNCIQFLPTTPAAGQMTATGVFFVQGTAGTNMYMCCETGSACSGNSASVQIFGTRSDPISLCGNNGWTNLSIAYDSGLRTAQPPGLPEKAYLVNFNVH